MIIYILAQVKIKFAFVPNYPDEVPGIEITESDNLDPIDEDELVELLNSTAKDSVGEEMIYTLILSAIEWLNKISDRRAKDKKEYEERKKQEEEELEMKKFEGTRVTVESFLVWKSKFETEMVKLNSKLYHEKNDKKLTGRELFERDKSLIESDLKFLQDETDLPDEDVDIKVDESLFESLDGLELDDE